MTKDDKINIKIEVLKDRNSGKLSILAHFNLNAPNVKKDKEDFIWIPTFEEKNLINDSFQLIPIDSSLNQIKTLTQNIEDTKKIIHPFQTATEYKQKIYENNSEINKEQSIFNIIKKEIKNENIVRDNSSYYENINQKSIEKKPRYLEINDKFEVEKKIVDNDSYIIEKALQKNVIKDNSILEEDEQTIIDRILNQKKKEKWSKR